MTKKKRQANENYVKMTTPKHDAETSTFTRVAAEITSNHEKSLTSQRQRCWNPVKSRPTRGLCRGGDCTTKSQKIFNISNAYALEDQAQIPDRRNDRPSSLPQFFVNSTPVPALVPAQYDGSGGPWQ